METSIKNENVFIRFFKRVGNMFLKIWSSKLYTFYMLLFIVLALLMFIIAFPAYYNGIINMASDDVLQYYAYVYGFFDKIKDGTLSVYDQSLLIGTSWFSGAYYIPLDLCTFIAFLLSYLIPAETAYSIAIFLHIGLGSLVFYYVLARHLNNKAAFLGALVILVGGLTEAYYIFPVYLGINLYAPLAMLIVDLIVEKKKWAFLLLPIYVVQVVFFDFYVAYMLLAFICFYFVIKMHISGNFSLFTRKNNLFINKEFWIDFLKFMGFIFLGLVISLMMLMPSALYILNESNRSSSKTTESIWYFNNSYFVDAKNIGTKRHYFTQLINLFITNEPHRFCLNDAGDYVREHATLYITSGGLIYLTYFFFLRGKLEFRLKFWVVIFNLMLCVPLFSIILGLNSSPYVRWFFIPYMINLYAAVIAMDKFDFKIGNKYNIIKIVPLLVIALGIGLIIYVLKTDTDYFIHYNKEDDYFYPILIGGLVFNIGYVVLLITSFILELFNKKIKFARFLIPGFMLIELIFAGAMVYGNVLNANSGDYFTLKEMQEQKDTLETLGYKESDGYRINMYTPGGRGFANSDIAINNVNFGRYFQSFYNTEINDLLSSFYGYTQDVTSWNKLFNQGYNLSSAPIFNTKYIVSDANINTPEAYYSVENINEINYYTLNEIEPFIVYDTVFTNRSLDSITSSKNNYFYRQMALLYYGYIPEYSEPYETYLESENSKKDLEYYESYQKILDYNFDTIDIKDIGTYLKNNSVSYDLSPKTSAYGEEYYVYNMAGSYGKELLKYDCLNIFPASFNDRTLQDGWNYIVKINDELDESGNPTRSFYQGHYNEIYTERITDENGDKQALDELWVQKVSDSSNSHAQITGFNYALYDRYLSEQANYTNKYFSLDGDTMKIKFTNPDTSKPRIIKTAFAYSKDWKLKNADYDLILVDSSFLGIIVPAGVSDVNLTLRYEPEGYYLGLKVAPIGLTIYLAIVSTYVIYYTRKKDEVLF